MNAERVSKGMPRREFLRISSVAAVGVIAVSVSDKALFAASAGSLDPLLSVGYAPSLPEKGFSTRLVSADSLSSPDPTFIRKGARVAIYGGQRAERNRTTIGGLAIDAVMPVRSRLPENYSRFNAWSVVGRDGMDSLSGFIQFTMPVIATTGLAFVVRHITGKPLPVSESQPALEAENTSFALSLSNGDGPKLQRGVYIVAMRESENESAPSWSRLSIVNNDGVYSVSGGNFAYAIVEVDYKADEPLVPVLPRKPRV